MKTTKMITLLNVQFFLRKVNLLLNMQGYRAAYIFHSAHLLNKNLGSLLGSSRLSGAVSATASSQEIKELTNERQRDFTPSQSHCDLSSITFRGYSPRDLKAFSNTHKEKL